MRCFFLIICLNLGKLNKLNLKLKLMIKAIISAVYTIAAFPHSCHIVPTERCLLPQTGVCLFTKFFTSENNTSDAAANWLYCRWELSVKRFIKESNIFNKNPWAVWSRRQIKGSVSPWNRGRLCEAVLPLLIFSAIPPRVMSQSLPTFYYTLIHQVNPHPAKEKSIDAMVRQ